MILPVVQAEPSRENVMRDPFGHHAAKWEKHFKELVEFHRNHGHFNVPAQYANNPSLGTWVNAQLVKMRKGQLFPYRQQRLENLGLSPAYRSPQGKQAWEVKFAQLVKFYKAHGHCNITRQGITVSLYNWVSAQRQAHDCDKLLPYRRRQLKNLGICWDKKKSPSRHEKTWDRNFSMVVRLYRKNGNLKIPNKIRSRSNLYCWINTQRLMKKFGRLRPDRQQRLEAMGFPWE
jgi:hypothetical protein